MAPLIIEGDTLGEKHRSYNKIVNDAIRNNAVQDIADIDYDDNDLDNLFKIDIASNNRNVEYILTVLKGRDMLYISRAIKQATWLITDPQYVYITNSNYLHNDLFPHMTSKAISKFLLHIRLNLKDERRVEEFFNYYEDKDLQAALKWLPNCSVTFIEHIIVKHTNDIRIELAKRLCEKSLSFLDVFLKNYKCYDKFCFLQLTKFLLNVNAEKYLDILEKNDVIRGVRNFGPKFTKILMTKCGEKIKQDQEKYSRCLHIPTFAKFIDKEEVKSFIIKHINKREMSYWFSPNNIKYIINRLPAENRFELVKEIFIDKRNRDVDADDKRDRGIVYYSARSARRRGLFYANNYCWYVYAPFNTAFTDLRKMIRTESNPEDRIAMFGVLLTCAKNNMHDIQTLVKYYRDNHINEPYKFKSQFVNLVIIRTKTHNFDKATWKYLNYLFISMDVYRESDKNIQTCMKSIILYYIIHDERIPDIIQNKFKFDTFKKYQNKLTKDEKKKLFAYLLGYVNSKLKKDIKTNEDLTEAVVVLKIILQLIEDWNKELRDFPNIISKIKDIIKIKKENKNWECNISKLYNIPKSWKKLFFTESIILRPNQKTCINALKHGPHILDSYKQEVDVLCMTDNLVIDRFLRKVRIYWPHSFANHFKNLYMNKLHENNNHKAILTGLCALLPQKELILLAKKYVPEQAKIDWNQHDEIDLSICKHIASSMHSARPQPSLDVALSYAKGDYLQYILPSLSAILHNISREEGRQYILSLLDAPVSLQKHGIRFSFKMMDNAELRELFSYIWESIKNSIIRSDIFTQTFNMLCKERDLVTITEIWQMLSTFIDSLTSEENKKIYEKLSHVDKVPLSVRAEFLVQSYRFLKSLPQKANCSSFVRGLYNHMKEIMEFIDDGFVEELLLESFDKRFSTERYGDSHLLAIFLLSCKTEEKQMQRYNNIFIPIINRAIAMWDTRYDNNYYVRYNFEKMCRYLSSEFQNFVLLKEMIIPVTMFKSLLDKLQHALCVHENYVLLTHLDLSLKFMKLLEDLFNTKKELIVEIKSKKNREAKYDNSLWMNLLHAEVAPEFGRICLESLKEDVVRHYPSIYNSFAESLKDVFEDFNFEELDIIKAIKSFLASKEFIQGHLLVLNFLPSSLSNSEDNTLTLELLDIIKSHPSEEIKMHYWLHYRFFL